LPDMAKQKTDSGLTTQIRVFTDTAAAITVVARAEGKSVAVLLDEMVGPSLASRVKKAQGELQEISRLRAQLASAKERAAEKVQP
jgi:hypothetical protein